MWEALQYQFMQHALLAGLLASLACGLIGPLVHVNRISFIAGGMAHACYGGIGLAFYLGLPVLATAMGFSVAVAALIAWVTLHQKHKTDAVMNALWAGGIAMGIILSDLTPGSSGELLSYLFGSILAVPQEELLLMVGMILLILVVLSYHYRDLLVFCYDAEYAKARGIKTGRLYLLLMTLLALSIVSVVRVVGIILILALLTIPPLILEDRVRSLAGMMAGAVLLNLAFTLAGLWISFTFNLASGASIILLAVTVYLGFQVLGSSRRVQA